jgi:hypothetical protein
VWQWVASATRHIEWHLAAGVTCQCQSRNNSHNGVEAECPAYSAPGQWACKARAGLALRVAVDGVSYQVLSLVCLVPDATHCQTEC